VNVQATVNGHGNPNGNEDHGDERTKEVPPPGAAGGKDTDKTSPSPKSAQPVVQNELTAGNADQEDGADSEAETLIDSPVKRKEAERQQTALKTERPPKHRIGSLPVPTDGDEDDSAQPSPAPSTIASMEKTTSISGVKDEEDEGQRRVQDQDDASEALSSPRSDVSLSPSRESSVRTSSELAEYTRNGANSPNPRKRKHRASSVSIPNKRPSLEPSKRRLRGLHSEELDGRTEASLSPKMHNHRRAASTQSAFMDAASEGPNRKRRSITQGLVKESKGSRPGWDESDASSENASHGQPDHRRPQRGVGRSTSTPGRPPGREHKRHVNKYGFTRLAEACESGDLDLVKEWRNRDPDQLELAEFAGNKPLQIAALNGNVEVVDYLIDQGCQIDCANVDKDTPLIDAAENGHLDVVHSLLRAGVDPLRQNLKGQQALDVVTDDTDDADEIRGALRRAIEEWNTNGSRQKREEEEELRHRAGPTKELHFMARTYENLLKLVQINDRNGVKEFLDARVPVDNQVIAAAAKTGDSYLVNMLLAEMTEKKAMQKPERPMLSVLGTSHFEMVRSLSELDNFNPLYRNRQGKTWPEIAEERHGPNWREERQLLQTLYDHHIALEERRSSSPVTKRDGGKRRYRGHADDSDEDEAPRRKNGRRLMSKRDMRVASGKAVSDASSDDSNSDVATGTERGGNVSMKPPRSPARRPANKPRTKSFSNNSNETSPRLRRPSSSFRGQSEQPLPTLDEGLDDHERAAAERQAAETSAADKAARLEIERREAEAEAEVRRAAEEAARKADEQRREQEARQAERERIAEEARKTEEARIHREQELANAKRKARDQVIFALPDPVSYMLNLGSNFDYEAVGALDYVAHYVLPLQVLKHEHQDPCADLPAGEDAPLWILNIQAAALIGKHGAELMLQRDAPGFEGSLADTWDTKEMVGKDRVLVESLLSGLPSSAAGKKPITPDTYDCMTFEEEMQRTADDFNVTMEMRRRLCMDVAKVCFVRLDQVLGNMHPRLRELPIEVRFDYLQAPARSDVQESGGFFSKLAAVLDTRPHPRRYTDGRAVDMHEATVVGHTDVVVEHEK
jgi:ankyrin repeat protein